MPQADRDALKKVTLNLYARDIKWFERHYGYGWSERVREFIRMHVHQRERPEDFYDD